MALLERGREVDPMGDTQAYALGVGLGREAARPARQEDAELLEQLPNGSPSQPRVAEQAVLGMDAAARKDVGAGREVGASWTGAASAPPRARFPGRGARWRRHAARPVGRRSPCRRGRAGSGTRAQVYDWRSGWTSAWRDARRSSPAAPAASGTQSRGRWWLMVPGWRSSLAASTAWRRRNASLESRNPGRPCDRGGLRAGLHSSAGGAR